MIQKKFKYITVIRDPVKRIKSFYEMQLNNKKLSFHNHAKKGLNYFVSKVKINQNCFCKFLIGDLNCDIDEEKFERAKDNLKNFFFIINFDNLEKDIEVLKSKLNIKESMKHIGKNKKERKNYSDNENNDIVINNTYDIKLWDYFKKNIKNLLIHSVGQKSLLFTRKFEKKVSFGLIIILSLELDSQHPTN